MQHFASDNYSGVCPEAMEYLTKVNDGHEPAYGNDRYTRETCDLFREVFDADCEVFFVFNGTAANSLSLATYCKPYHSVIASSFAHIETDECGAPEFFSHGSKILLSPSDDGKLSYQGIEDIVNKRNDIHYPKPKVVSVTQATELGTIYSKEELVDIKNATDAFDLKLHMDGARFANAVAELNVSPAEITRDVGVDVLCMGGSKNGLALGDAIVFFNKEDAEEFAYRCKQSGQLASKMRYISAQWLGILKDGAWLRHARHANECAAYMEQQILQIPELKLLVPRQANSVFVELPQDVRENMLSKGWLFYTFIGAGGARLMCSWDTDKARIDELIGDLKSCLAKR